jgi:uncharacterized protein YhbP (UPF0306 family)
MDTELDQLAKKVIEENQYLSLATIDSLGNPWICVLAYAYDADWNILFVSLPTSRHSRNVAEHATISFAIYDSRQLVGQGFGIQGEGTVRELSESELSVAEPVYFGRKYPYGTNENPFVEGLKPLLKDGTYRFYRLKPTKLWMNNPKSKVDERVEVRLPGAF